MNTRLPIGAVSGAAVAGGAGFIVLSIAIAITNSGLVTQMVLALGAVGAGIGGLGAVFKGK